ncbi:MAG: hypothetical protein ACOH2E_06450 [Candidatus Paracaedibacter sp.]
MKYFPLKLNFNLKVVFLLVFATLQTLSMEKDEKPTEFLFAAMGYYEQAEFQKAAHIFKRYAGKPVPVAETFCLDLVKKGYLEPFKPIPSNNEVEENQKASMYFTAAQQFLKIKNKKSNNTRNKALNQDKVLTDCLKAVQPNLNGSLLYLIGTLYESKINDVSENRKKAKTYFISALERNDLRAVLGLKRVCSPEEFKKLRIKEIPLSSVSRAFDFMPVLHQDEGQICASLSCFFINSPQQTFPCFLLSAAQFGHAKAQFLQAQSLCENESQILYWMMQSAEHDNCKALSFCGHMMEQGMGTPVNYQKAYAYLQRATDHPDATAIEFSNFALLHELGEGTPVDYQAASRWRGRAYEADPSNQEYTYDYGRTLNLIGQYEKALPLLSCAQNYSDDAACDYASVLFELTPAEGGLTEVVDIFFKLASKGHLDAACRLVYLAVADRISYELQDLIVYKSYLEKAIEQEKASKKKIAKGYYYLRSLYTQAKWLFDKQENLQKIDLSKKAYESNPQDLDIKFVYAQDLKDSGRYQEALDHFLSLQKSEYPLIWNTIGTCYDLLAKDIQAINPDKSRKFMREALQYYQKQLEENNSVQKALAAFNIYCLSLQNRIEPLTNEELVRLLEIAADAEDEEALNDLAVAYLCGLYGLSPDHVKAERLLRIAIAQGCQEAKLNLMDMKFREASLESKHEASQLFNELWAEDTQKFKYFLEGWIASVYHMLLNLDEKVDENEGMDAQEMKSESEKDGSRSEQAELINHQVTSASLTPTSSIDVESDEEEYPEELWKQYVILPLSHEIEGSLQLPVVLLTQEEKEQQAGKERLQKKFERLSSRVEALRGTKQTKYRKIKTLINQHIRAFGGGVKNGKGSGRRIELGSMHSGFHQPHKADIKGGAFKSLTTTMYNSSQEKK